VRSVRFRVEGRTFSLDRHAAASFARNLDRLSAGTLGEYRRIGAPSLLERVDDAVVGNSHDRIELDGDEAEAAFSVLNASTEAQNAEQGKLNAALRCLRDDSP
jgi:hypothetical protein